MGVEHAESPLRLAQLSVTVHRGTIDDTELINGLVFTSRTGGGVGGPSKVEKAKVGFIQFCISPPKTDVSYNCVGRFAPRSPPVILLILI